MAQFLSFFELIKTFKISRNIVTKNNLICLSDND